MNIFYLDRNPILAADAQCDRHVVKMILETAQLLSTAHHELDGESPAYKPTHKNHPSSVWVRASLDHYVWAYDHMMALGDEYTRRYGKVHKTIAEKAEALAQPPRNIEDLGFTDPPQCMPDECKRADTVEAYQVYYAAKAAEWAERGLTMTWRA